MSAARTIAVIVLIANAGLLGGVVVSGTAGGALSGYEPAPLETLKEQVNAHRLRLAQGGPPIPSAHTPSAPQQQTPPRQTPPRQTPPRQTRTLLAGMDGFTGEACPALEAFLSQMDAALLQAGAQPPGIDRGALLQTSCSISEDTVRGALLPYRRAFKQAGLTPLHPFRFLGGPR